MRKSVLMLVTKTFVSWLARELPPAGKPALPLFEARAVSLIDALPNGIGPDVGEPSTLTEEQVATALDWVFATMLEAYPSDDWAKLAIYALRHLALQAAPEMLQMIMTPRKSLDSGTELKPPPPPSP
jgi:hypothetical protein